MIEIKPKDCEKMKVWDDDIGIKAKRLVLAKAGGYYIAVSDYYEREFKAGERYEVSVWEHAKPIKKKLTAVVKSAEEITGLKNVAEFTTYNINGDIYCQYIKDMNDLAGRRIEIVSIHNETYQYEGSGHYWLKSWLKDFVEVEE